MRYIKANSPFTPTMDHKNRQRVIFLFLGGPSPSKAGKCIASLGCPRRIFRGFRKPESTREKCGYIHKLFPNPMTHLLWLIILNTILGVLCSRDCKHVQEWEKLLIPSLLLALQSCQVQHASSPTVKKLHEDFGNDWKHQEIFHCNTKY